MKRNPLWPLSILALGLAIGTIGIVHARTNDGSATTASGWWNRRLPIVKPVKPTPRFLRQRIEVANRSPEAVAQAYLERNWEWLIGVDSTDRSHGMSYSYTKTSQRFRGDNTVIPAVQYQQLYHGVPVYGGEFGVAVPTNPLDPYPEFSGRVFNIKGLDATPVLSREGAVAALKRAIAPDSLYSTELVDTVIYDDREPTRERMRKMTAKLIVYPAEPPVLVYRFATSVWAFNGGGRPYIFLVDAKTGELLQGSSLSEDWDPSTAFGQNRLVPPLLSDSVKIPHIMRGPIEIRRGTFPDTTLERMDRERDSLDRTRPPESYPVRPQKPPKANCPGRVALLCKKSMAGDGFLLIGTFQVVDTLSLEVVMLSMADKTRPLITQFYHDLWNQWRYDLIPELISPDIQFRGSLGVDSTGRDEFESYMRTVQLAFPDFHNDIREMVVDGNRAAVRLMYSGTHRGEIFGTSPTGSRVEYAGAAFFQIREGQIAIGWVLGDTASLRRQLEDNLARVGL